MKRLSIFTFIIIIIILSLAPVSAQDDDDTIIGTPSVQSPEAVNGDVTIMGQSTGIVQQNVQPTTEEAEVIRLTNELRASLGLGCLAVDSSLITAGRLHAQDMGVNRYFNHTGLDGSSALDRARRSGYTGTSYFGENISAGTNRSTGLSAYTSWVNSSGHYANMVRGNYNVIGVGRAYVAGSPYGYYWVMMLGRHNNPPPCNIEANAASNLNRSGSLTSAPVNLTFSWTHDTTEETAQVPPTSYRLYMVSGSTVYYDNTFNVASVCSGTSCSFTPNVAYVNGTYAWYVGAMANGAIETWTQGSNFTINVPAPGEVTRQSPSQNSANVSTNPTLQWTHTGNASYYEVYVVRDNGVVAFHNWVQVGNGVTCGGSTCSMALSNLTNGVHNWYVRAYNPGGVGPWNSSDYFFRVGPLPPGEVTRQSPSQNSANVSTNPTLQWAHTGNATYYEVYVVRDNGVVAFHNWVQVGNGVNCGGSTCSMALSNLTNGVHNWYVRAYNPGGVGPWNSSDYFFRVGPPPPGEVIRQTPSSGAFSVATNPTLQWAHTGNATYYEVYVVHNNGVVAFHSWVEVGNQVTCTTACTMPLSNLNPGGHNWYVRAYNPGGVGPWNSADHWFTVN